VSAIKLEACPFCGSDDVKVYHDTAGDHRYDWEYFVECQSCAASGSQWKHEEDAIAAWNRRAQPAEEVQQDAKRYRYMMRDGETAIFVVLSHLCATDDPLKPQMDAAIDEAMAKDTP